MPKTTTDRVVTMAAGIIIGLAAGMPLGAMLNTAPTSSAAPAGQLQEDDPGWDCRTGDRVCGPAGDDWGHTPGCYDAGMNLVAAWPCSIVDNADGSSDVFTPEEA